jgi:hypothetical protein
MKLIVSLCRFLFIAAPIVWLECSKSPMAGGGTIETTNGAVAGIIVFPSGGPGYGTLVRLLPSNYDPVNDTVRLATDTTDSLGHYRFSHVDSGDYVVEAIHVGNATRSIQGGIRVAGDTISAPTDTLRVPGSIKVALPTGVDQATGYVYIPGTTHFAFLKNHSDFTVLDSAPAGLMPVINYSVKNGAEKTAIRYNVRVISGDTAIVGNPSWKYARTLILNTSATGANIAGDVLQFPILLRLNSGNFDFSQAKSNGADIRFAKNDTTPLPYEIERWDSASELAEVWVNVDTVHGNDSAQSIIMYYGNYSAADSSNGPAVFDTAAAFQGVWHLCEAGNSVALDATANHYDGTVYGMSDASSISGEVGKARGFNGSSSYITMPNTKNSKLNFPQDSYYTISAWVSLDTFDNASHCIVSKGYYQYYLRSTYVKIPSPTTPLWEFVEFNENTKWRTLTFPTTGRQWTLLTGVKKGNSQILYCNGAFADSTVVGYPNPSAPSRNTSNDLSVGRFFDTITLPSPEGFCFFKGSIDEVRICSAARSLDWILLCYMNQRTDDRLVRFK